MRDRALLIAVLLLTAFAGPRVVSGITGWGGSADLEFRSPVGGEAAALEEQEAGFGPAARGVRQEVALPAQVVDFTPESTTVRTFPTTDYADPTAGPRAATTDWRVVMGTGNAAELWLHGTQDGRLLDLGGRYINYTDDGGVTWKSVRPTEPLINAEGSVIAAPNGDIVAVTWDPYSGDRIITYKYVAAEKDWYYMYQPIHTPFWDRPGIDVVPGPFTDPLGNSVPYLTFINGLPHDPWQYSYDGLNYPGVSYRSRDAGSTPPISSWLDVKPDPMRDYTQVEADGLFFGFAPLDDGQAWSENLMFTRGDMQWHRWTSPDGKTIEGGLQIDSRGWLHNVQSTGTGFQYRVSTDGGRTWSSAAVPGVGRPGDFKANAAAGVAAVWSLKGKKDMVTKLDITGAQPRVLRVYDVGLGDDPRTGGIGFYGLTGGHRFDFSSIVVLPDGRVAVSFMDSKTNMHFPTLGTDVVAPGLAIELDTTVAGG